MKKIPDAPPDSVLEKKPEKKGKERLAIISPGRGTYTKETLNYLKGRSSAVKDKIGQFDQMRAQLNLPTITELDSATTYNTNLHTRGDHASPLIYACALADCMEIDLNKYEICVVAGNSLGWYLTLAMGGALSHENAFRLIQTMGSLMQENPLGGQVIYPISNDQWQVDVKKEALVEATLKDINGSGSGRVYISIRLGGYVVIAGDEPGLQKVVKWLPPQDHFPFRLVNHNAFHSPILQPVSEKAMQALQAEMFEKPKIPMVDGRGFIWSPYSTDPQELYYYTLEQQVTQTYDFEKSIEVVLKEFNPDRLVLLGPGNSLGAAAGNILIKNNWHFLSSKDEFIRKQKENPIVVSMGLPDQKKILT